MCKIALRWISFHVIIFSLDIFEKLLLKDVLKGFVQKFEDLEWCRSDCSQHLREDIYIHEIFSGV